MHRHYSEQRRAIGKAVASYDCHSRIFNKAFNIGFFITKKDQSDLCESYTNVAAADKEKLESRYNEYLKEKELSRAENAKDKKKTEKSEIILTIYDLQAVLPVPNNRNRKW